MSVNILDFCRRRPRVAFRGPAFGNGKSSFRLAGTVGDPNTAADGVVDIIADVDDAAAV